VVHTPCTVPAMNAPADTTAPVVRGDDVTGSGATEQSTRAYTRSPEDVLRLVGFAALAVLLMALTAWAEESIFGVEQDLLQLFQFLSDSVLRVIHGTAEIVAVMISLGVYGVALSTKRYRLLGYVALASVATFAAMSGIDALIDRDAPSVVNQLLEGTDIGDSTLNGVVQLSQLSAMFIVVRPFVGRQWRRTGIATITLLVLVELLVATELPVDLFLALPVGAMIGTAVLLIFGRPDRHPTLGAIAASLRDAGLPVTEVRAAKVDARGSTPYFATLTDGTGLFVKVLGGQERAADLLFRVYRFFRLKNVGDNRPFSSLRRTVDHEAFIALMARDIGVRTPRLRGVVDVGEDSMLLAYEMIDGSSIDGVAPEVFTDDLMRQVWEQVAILREHRIAHRDLRRANVFVQDDGVPWIIDFGFSELAVSDEILDADVAQMVASFAVVVGAERAVRAAVDAIGADAVGQALPRLQMAALSGATQTALKEHKGLLEEVQAQVIEQCNVENVEFTQLQRVSKKTIFTAVMIVLVTYFLLPQFADLPGIVDQVKDANWAWTVAASISLAGAIPHDLPSGPLFMSTVGSSFASKLAPAGIGGMAMNIRFLQKQGVDEPVAVSGVGLNTIAGLVGHMTLIGIFIVWAGSDAFGSFRLPDPKWFIIALVAALVVLAIAMAIPASRRIFLDRLRPIIMKAFRGVGDVLRRPSKVVMLVGGSALVTFAYLTTLYFSTVAFGGGLPFATVGAVFLVGSAVASAAPTPGGLGAVEAALIAGLVSAGMDNSIAVPAVFMYRLFTFWVPILPGWLSFQWLQRNEYI
jgi:glycosyltransferase 2 family protein